MGHASDCSVNDGPAFIPGTYHHWSAAHIHRYLAEFDLRYSTKGKDDTDRAADILKGMEGRRLTYRRTGLLAA